MNKSQQLAEFAIEAAMALQQPHRVRVACCLYSVQHALNDYAACARRCGATWTAAQLRSKARDLLRAISDELDFECELRNAATV